ncbi:phosphoinositide phosphatase family protein isoform X2 [Carex rostrata]
MTRLVTSIVPRYKRLLCTVDLTKDFFFSYSYNIMRSLQKNICEERSGQVLYETMFVWNEFLSRSIRHLLKNTTWTVALVHGFFKQSNFSVSGKNFRLTLIARRSRHFAGTRYLKRGVNEKGRVANDVETEQIVFEDTLDEIPTQITSVVQNRGSIPLMWSQETSKLNIRPDIILQKDSEYKAMRLHFDNLVMRYGRPIIILNLIKTKEKKPRESLLRAEFAKSIHVINKDLPEEERLRFLHWDLSKHARREGNALAALERVASNALDLTGIFHCEITPEAPTPDSSDQTFGESSGDNKTSTDATVPTVNNCTEIKTENTEESEAGSSGSKLVMKPIKRQKGVLRTNCIDCLDRTNVAQYAYGLIALGRQLHFLGLIDDPRVDLDAPLANYLMDFYEKMGDTLAFQYGGSAAHNKIFCERRGQWRPATQSQEFLRTIQRYYSNAYLDFEKQDAINVFLGHFLPQQGKPALWELDSDQHYNLGRRGHSFTDEFVRSFIKRSLSDGNILTEDSEPVSTNNGGGTENVVIGLHHLPSEEISESAPEIDTENELSYSRFYPTLPGRQLFPESGHVLLNGPSLDESHASNFLDLDWLSSSGNSCEDEFCERSSIINSTPGTTSMDNVVVTDTEKDEASSDQLQNSSRSLNPVDEFSHSFGRWVAGGGLLCF